MKHNIRHSAQAILAQALPSDDKALEELAGRLNTRGNVLAVFRSGDYKVPLDRAFRIADAVNVDRAQFFTACLAQFMPEEDMQKFCEAFAPSLPPREMET